MSNVAGYFTRNGRSFPACSCQLAWLPVYEAELLRIGEIRSNIDPYQLIGGATASAGTHARGGANDLGQFTARALKHSRNMGCADSHRTRAQGFDIAHGHGGLKGCPHAAASLKAQIREIEAGGDGLVGNRKDTGPRSGVKWPLRSWKQGIKWAAGKLPVKKVTAGSDLFYVTTDGLAGRSYPGVGPVLIRRKRQFKIRATASYVDPWGKLHYRTKYGTWYAAAYLARVKPAKAPSPTTGVRQHKGRAPLGPLVGLFMTWNLAIDNAVGKVTWLKRRGLVRNIIIANKLTVLFVTERPQAGGTWLDGRLGDLTQKVGASGRYIYLARWVKLIGWSKWVPKAKLKGGKVKPVTFATVEINKQRLLLVCCHPQAGSKNGPLRGQWANEVLDEAERRGGGRYPIIFGGDFQGAEFLREARRRGYESSRSAAHTTVNAMLKSFNKWSKKQAEGYQMDQIISKLPVDESRLIWNGTASDHNRVRTTIHLPA